MGVAERSWTMDNVASRLRRALFQQWIGFQRPQITLAMTGFLDSWILRRVMPTSLAALTNRQSLLVRLQSTVERPDGATPSSSWSSGRVLMVGGLGV
jgi:hypothetical protein